MCNKKTIELTLKEGEVLADNNHKYVEIEGGEIIEMKYCPHCKEWHSLEDFSISSAHKDGLQSWCRACQGEYCKQRCVRDRESSQEEETMEEQVVDMNCFDKAMDLLSSMRVREIERQEEIERLKDEVKSLEKKAVDLTSLRESEIEIVLKSNKIALRLLFESIARQDDRYTFYAVDTITGLTAPIKLENSEA